MNQTITFYFTMNKDEMIKNVHTTLVEAKRTAEAIDGYVVSFGVFVEKTDNLPVKADYRPGNWDISFEVVATAELHNLHGTKSEAQEEATTRVEDFLSVLDADEFTICDSSINSLLSIKRSN